jgi:DDE superfamily endonuclease
LVDEVAMPDGADRLAGGVAAREHRRPLPCQKAATDARMERLPRSLTDLLMAFRPCFTTPTFKTFIWLVVGFLAQPGTRTVTGMLAGARLAGSWHHSRAHRFFAAARWSADALGLVVLEVIVACLLGPDAPLDLVVDDTLFRRSGRKVWGAAWHHDPLAAGGKGRRPVPWGNCWVVVGVLVRLPFVPTGRCACRCCAACGAPSSPTGPSWPWRSSWWAWSPSATLTARST